MGYSLKNGVELSDVKLQRHHWGDGFGWGFHLVYWNGTAYSFAFEDIFGAMDSLGRVNSNPIEVDIEEDEIFVVNKLEEEK